MATYAHAVGTNPTAAATLLGGWVLIVAGAGLDVGGAAACVTGVGCAATPAAEGAGTGMIVTGFGLGVAGAVAIGSTAAADPITVVERTGQRTGGTSSSPGTAPRTVNPSSPASSPVWRATSPFRGKYRTNGLFGKDREYYRWDYTHHDIEVYDSKGREIGSRDPVTGDMIKGPPRKPRQPGELR